MRWLIIFLFFLLVGCGFHLQTETYFKTPLRSLYVSSNDPYGTLMRYLKMTFKNSNVSLMNSPSKATTKLVILSDHVNQELLSVSNSQQIRQYNLHITVIFQVTGAKDQILFGPETLSDSRVITIQSNQILAGSNEIHTLADQIYRSLAAAIIDRLSSEEVANIITSNMKEPS